MSKNKKLIPELRFPEFKNEGEWEIKTIGDLANSESSSMALNKLDLKPTGYPVYGADSIVGYIDEFQHKEKYISIVKDGSGVGRLNLCQSNSSVLGTLTSLKSKNKKQYDLDWLYYLLNTVDFSVYVKGAGIPHIYYSDFKNENVPVPTPKEQQKIAYCLSSLDEIIEAHNQKLDLLNNYKKGLIQNLFPQEGEKVPKFRFREFKNEGVWLKETVGDVYDFKVTNSFAREYLNYENGTVKNIHYGDIHTKFNTLFDINRENVPFINTDVSIDKIRKECYCNVGDIVFADASEDMNDVGKSIEIVNLNKEKLVSGLHTLLARQKGKKLAIGFGGYLFKSDWVRKQIQREAQGAKVIGISATRISNVQISYPKNHKEQEAISLCLSSLDEVIISQTEKIKQLKQHKQGMIQGLFPKMID
jgi:type I restriction enzyme S subunit